MCKDSIFLEKLDKQSMVGQWVAVLNETLLGSNESLKNLCGELNASYPGWARHHPIVERVSL